MHARWFVVLLCTCVAASSYGQESATPGADAWPMFRGNSMLTGVATGKLPDKLEVLWRYETKESIQSSAAIVDGMVYVGSDDGFLYALDRVSGSLRWKFETAAGIRASPTVHGDLVLFGNEDGLFCALDRRGGRKRWSYKVEAEIISSANCADDRVVFGCYDGSLYCLALSSGKLLWKFETESRIHGTPSISGGHVIVAGCDELLHVVRLSDGTAERAVRMGGVSGASAALSGDRVFVGTFGNQVLCIDWKKGVGLWTYENPDRKFPFFSSAAVTDRLVVIGGRDRSVHALDIETGKARWVFPTQARVESSPVIAGERVLVGSSDGNLYELDLATGRERWKYEAGAPILASPAVAEGCLVFGTDDGIVYCFGNRPGGGTRPVGVENPP